MRDAESEQRAEAASPLVGAGRQAVDPAAFHLGQRQPNTSEADLTPVSQEILQGAFVHEAIERQAKRTPNAVAIQFEDERLTYAELDARSNQLAQYLKRLDLDIETLVGVCIERSVNMVVGMLGILKAGRGYLPLDPAYPAERLAYMLDNAQVDTVLVSANTDRVLRDYQGKKLCLDSEWEAISSESAAAVRERLHPEGVAYMTYTSGSTGRPKGILTLNRGLMNYLRYFCSEYSISSQDVVLNVSSIAFDASARDIYAPLCSGARLVLVPSGRAKDPTYLRAAAKATRVSVIPSIVPSLLQEVSLVSSQGGAIECLRLILTSGEPLASRVVETVRSRLSPGATIVNQYGPTETTMTVTYFPIRSDERVQGSIPIGRAIPNTCLYVLDERLELVSHGAVGQLFIGGLGLARGYFRRPPMTADRFVANPFVAGERMYRSGDLVCKQANGHLEFVGRLDNQVKIHGNRVELAEIEATMMRYPSVLRAAVVLKAAASENARLVGYMVAEGHVDLHEIRRFLRENLQEHMVPSSFVQLSTFPETENGKIDRSRLPEPEASRPAARGAEPRTPTERKMVAIWRSVIDISDLGVHDNFFDIGGNSILAMRLVLQIFNEFLVDLPTHALLDASTVAELSREVDDLLGAANLHGSA